MRNKIAIIADTQLYKRLYGEESARTDWYDAFKYTFSLLEERASELAAILILGDVMESNEVGASAAYTYQKVLSEFAHNNIPIGMVLGNHDNDFASDKNWVEVAKLSNPNVTHLSLSTPLVVHTDAKDIYIYGTDYAPRDKITEKLHNFNNPGHVGEVWLCLHQALKELAPHKFAWDVTSEQVPNWVDKVFLGHFHNMSEYTGLRGTPFIYPGAIETESFSQTEKPGFIIFDTETNTYTHICTQQREYITYYTEGKLSDQIYTELSKQIQESYQKFAKPPVVRVIYTPETYQEYLKVVGMIEASTLKTFAIEASNGEQGDFSNIYTGNIAEAGAYQTKEGILKTLPTIMETLDVSADEQEDILKLIHQPENISEIKTSKFNGAVYKKINL